MRISDWSSDVCSSDLDSMDQHSLLANTVVYLAAAVIAVPIAKRLRLGSVLGYLIAGIIVGPWGLQLITDVEAILHFSEFGVVMLLFVIGLERSEEHTSELQSLMRISYAVFCLKKKIIKNERRDRDMKVYNYYRPI